MLRLILICLLAFTGLTSSGQLLNQGRMIYVKGTDLSVTGSVDNQGTIANDGILSVSGDWNNTGQYTAGTGTFILSSDAAQNVTHNKDSVFILVLNGKGEKILKDEAEVVKTLQFDKGLLTIQGGAIIVRNTGSIINASSTAYVNGKLFLEGNGKKFYPIGKGNVYLPVTLENADVNGQLLLGFEAFAPGAGVPGIGMKSINTDRYWQLSKRGTGTFNGSLITIGLSDQALTPAEEVVVAEADAADGKFRSLGQSAISATSVTSNILITGSFFALGLSDLLDENDVFVPSAFSPAATNPEDQAVKVYGDLLLPDEFEFQVFSKWGNLIFETRSLQEMKTTGWNSAGNEVFTDASLGVYTYAMRGKFINGNAFKKNGTITVLK